uniref:Protein kinase domain-containing protein n=1 Tax=Paramoeba aestuarina TaxID=180227 RepID=A0A7S4NYN3_9EUKA|mmetsp:Transcript_32796/g.51259  ORF Transcript_32796/g.51259 Transcript_32796/m.51259 type:complete len:466 (+) Transcript_32796:132-1529(+)|eukprot:CAMPEP_0201508908 /NCGR_PEP_ID=MMETSP0161_2-20130828/2108_1 /ASSEMBLY_ACC=CAM_ASM_000251 /TAXON_ID=180227 /ORGANISM="Neoparamoeba aestuarina, Strain SoJaBio B1-5/56/2" /LENGTH=465 /DNA_ID=CAMNT_0047903699 /DNA_START=85 /DNA_END=1482 /DNA_ORIENTATION=-
MDRPTASSSQDGADSKRRKSLWGGLFRKNEKASIEEEEYIKEMKRRMKLREKSEKAERTRSFSEVPSDKFKTMSNSVGDTNPQQKNYSFYAERIEDLPVDILESLERMRLPRSIVEANFELVLNIVSFADKHVPRRRFVTHAQMDVVRANRKICESNVTDRILLSPDQAYERYSFVDARALYKWDVYLGHGGFGQVVEAKCKDKKDPTYGKRVALKFQNNSDLRGRRMNLEEVSLLKFCDHPNIVKLHRVLEVRSEVWMVMELMRGGNLRQASSSKVTPFREKEIAFVAREALLGIQYLHQQQIVHRDLKDLNMMMSLDGEVKLIDFGLAVDMSNGPRVQMVGSPQWMSPEMIRGEPHWFPVDIWSFMVCVLELANQKPREKANVKRAMFLTATVGIPKKFEEPEKWTHSFKEFAEWGAIIYQEKRPTATKLLEHSFIQSACDIDQIKKRLHKVFMEKAVEKNFA